MRVEPYAVGSFLHIVKRGARGLPIAHDDFDRRRFLRALYYLNDEYLNENWDALKTATLHLARPAEWPPRQPLVRIAAFTLMPNHMHLLVEETHAGGVTQFMKRLGQSMTNHHNQKYGDQGSLFQGSFRSRTVLNDRYLRYVAAYIMVKNVFELYPTGGIAAARRTFEDAWEWATTYPYSSLGHYFGEPSPIVESTLLGEAFTPREFKAFARDVIKGGSWETAEFE